MPGNKRQPRLLSAAKPQADGTYDMKKALLVTLAAALFAVWSPLEIARPVAPVFADDDDDDDDGRGSRRFGRDFVPSRAARPEVIASGLSQADLDLLLTRGFTLLRTRQIGLLGSPLYRLQIPPRLSLKRALDEAR